ncbi:FkbM family methyltransferase [Paracoccaceae bacterium]|nr:FkbM family methyltransferase [Paracoccaceae bacterium]
MYQFTEVKSFEIIKFKEMIENSEEISLSKKLIKSNIIAYGCGDLGAMCRQFCAFENIIIDYFVDKNWEVIRRSDCWSDTNVISVEELSCHDPIDTVVVICVANFSLREIFNDLVEMGFDKILTFYDFAEILKKEYPINNGWYCKIDSIDWKRVNNVMDSLSDGYSKAHYQAFLAWHAARIEVTFTEYPIEANNKFILSNIPHACIEEHRLIDVGAHHGKIVQNLSQIFKGKLKKVWCFEPDLENLNILRSRLDKASFAACDLQCFATCVTSVGGNVRFLSGFNYASSVNENGTLTTSAAIDDLGLDPTLIKIHTEGSELEVLRGAIKTIRYYRPIVMMTVYHNKLGLFEIQEFIMKHLTEYKIFFRNHSYVGTGAVIYAIPGP